MARQKAEAEHRCQTFRSIFELMLDHERSVQEMSLKEKKTGGPAPILLILTDMFANSNRHAALVGFVAIIQNSKL